MVEPSTLENCVVSFPEEIGRESEIMKLKPRIEPRSREYEGGVGGWLETARGTENPIRELMACRRNVADPSEPDARGLNFW